MNKPALFACLAVAVTAAAALKNPADVARDWDNTISAAREPAINPHALASLNARPLVTAPAPAINFLPALPIVIDANPRAASRLGPGRGAPALSGDLDPKILHLVPGTMDPKLVHGGNANVPPAEMPAESSEPKFQLQLVAAKAPESPAAAGK